MPLCKANTDRLRGYRIKIYPTEEQKKEIDLNIRLFRAVYNLAIEFQNIEYEETGLYIKYFDMCKIFSKLYKSENYKWLRGITISTIRESLRACDDAYRDFFRGNKNHPKFKSKKYSKKSFSTRSERTLIKGNKIQLSGFKSGLIEAKKHNIPDSKRLYSSVITFDGYNYWFSCTIEKPIIDMSDIPQSEPIGIDVGIRNMITTSDGEYYHFSDTSKYEKRLKRQQRRLSKDYNKYFNTSIHTRTKYEDVPKSKNHFKRLAKQHKSYSKIRNKKHNDIHNATKQIVSKNPSAIVIENISVREQIKDQWMLKYAPQMMYYEIHRQLKYKAADRNIPVIIADKHYPSSQICSRCGKIHNPYSHKIFKCPYCGLRIDRDLNAALNLKSLVPPENNEFMLQFSA